MTIRFRRPTSLIIGAVAVTLTGNAFAQLEEITTTARKREENLQDVPVAVSAFTSDDIQRLAINDLQDLGKYTSSVIFDTGFAPQDTRVVIRGLAPVRGRQNVAILQDGIDISSQAITTNGGSLLINPRYFDVERIEVVKGPQNALYGRTAFNGAINYVMRKPTDEFAARVFTDIGQNGQAELRGSISGPIVGDTLLGDISVAGWNFDGFYRNSITGGEVGGEEGTAVATSLVWNATERLSFRLRAEWLDDEYAPFPYVQLLTDQRLELPQGAVTPPAPGLLPILNPNINQANGGPGVRATVGTLPPGDSLTLALSENPRTGGDYPGTSREIARFTLTGEWDLGPATLTYLGHVADAETSEFSDGFRDGSVSVNFVGAETRIEGETDLQSHELRLASNGAGRFDWTVGALYWNEEADVLEGSFNCINLLFFPPFPPCADLVAAVGTDASPLNPDPWTRETTHWSVYGLVDWQIVDRINLIFEGRYTDEEFDSTGPVRETTSRIIGVPGNAQGYPQTIPPVDGVVAAPQDDSFFSPKFTLQWSPTDDMMYYASWAQTFKPAGVALFTGGAGGFNPEGQTFDTEEMQVWEVGAKTEWFDDRVTFNAALFFQDYTDKQVSVQRVDPGTGLLVPRTENASAAEVLGLEADVNWFVTEWLQLRASYTYLDTEYTDFVELTTGAGNIALGGNCTPDDSLIAGDFQCRIDLSGNELEFAPEHAFVGGFTLQSQLVGETDWFLDGNVIYQGERFTNRFNSTTLDSYTVADFRLGLRGSSWEVVAYLENAFDDDTIRTSLGGINTAGFSIFGPFTGDGAPTTVVLPPSQILLLPPQRQFGVRANFRFGGAQ